MLHIQNKCIKRQMDLFFLAENNEFEIIVWLHPESKLKHLFGFDLLKLGKYKGKPVTEITGGRCKLNDSLFNLQFYQPDY